MISHFIEWFEFATNLLCKENDTRSLLRYLTEMEVFWYEKVLTKAKQPSMTEQQRDESETDNEVF